MGVGRQVGNANMQATHSNYASDNYTICWDNATNRSHVKDVRIVVEDGSALHVGVELRL